MGLGLLSLQNTQNYPETCLTYLCGHNCWLRTCHTDSGKKFVNKNLLRKSRALKKRFYLSHILPHLVCIVTCIGGIQLFCMGIMGQYIAKTYMEVKRRPHYIIKESNCTRNKKNNAQN